MTKHDVTAKNRLTDTMILAVQLQNKNVWTSNKNGVINLDILIALQKDKEVENEKNIQLLQNMRGF